MEQPTPNPWTGIVASLADVPEPVKPRHKFNPHPKGCIQPGSTADKFLQIFQAQPRRIFTAEMLRNLSGVKHPASSWALIHLRTIGRIDGMKNMERPGYLRYRLKPPAGENE
jgi:hypothetical protein